MWVRGITVRTWWSSLPRPRDRGRALRLIVSTAVGFVLFLLWASHPAVAAADELRVIAVHTASAPDVSMVVAPPSTPPEDGSEAESCSVTIDGEPVATTVTPMASGDLSVALVIDTASDLTAQELAAVQSGAADFLLRLPQDAQTMVVAAGGEPQVVAPLSADRAEALSAISALRTGGSHATNAGTRLAAQSLESAPPGPRVIIAYAHGPDEQGPSVEQLSEAVLQADAVVNVITPGAESIWPSVVDRTGGIVFPPTNAADIAQSYGRLATMLSEQYLVTFQVPGDLPAVAQVAFQSGDQEYSTVVDLPDADTGQAAPTQGRGIVGLVSLVVAGLVLIGLAVAALVLRTRRRASVPGGPLAEAAAPPASTIGPAPALAIPATEEEGGGRPSDDAPSSTLASAPATSPPQPRSRRGSLTDAVHGRRLARHDLELQPEQTSRPRPPHGQQQRQLPPADKQPRPPPPDTEFRRGKTSADSPVATLLSRIGLRIAARIAPGKKERSAEDGRNATIVLAGSGDAVVDLTKNPPGPAAVNITGNAASRYFSVRALGTEDDLVITLDRYQGTRSLNWDGGEATGFKIRATGSWRIEVLPITAIPTFNTSFKGQGDMVVRFTGNGTRAEITGNHAGRYFNVRAFGTHGIHRLVNTTQAYSGSCQINQGPQIFEVQAIGPWTITVK
jgi:von Willebrand factor type A domain